MELNFKTKQKKCLLITFADDKKISVLMPTKEMFEQLQNLKDEMLTMTSDDLYDLAANLMSRNLENSDITRDYLVKALDDVGDLMELLKYYTAFIQTSASDPN